MQARSPSALATTARLTSSAPAAAAPPTVPPQAPSQTPPQAPATADRKSSKREREHEASPERSTSPLARRAQPLTPALITPLWPSDPRASYRSTPAFAAATQLGTRRAGATPPAPAQSAAGQPPEGAGQDAFSDSPILAIVAAYAAREQPLAYLSGLRQALQGQPDVDGKARNTLMRERSEALLEVHPSFRSEEDYRRYFEAGGSLEKLVSRPLNPAIRQMAIEARPLDLKFVTHRSLALCEAAVSRDGYALEFVPRPLLAPGSEHREKLVARAYDSARPPRIKHVPHDLQTEARCIRSLQWAPLDLADVHPDVITLRMCEACLDYLPEAFTPDISVIPRRLRDERMARLLLPLPKLDRDFKFPERAWHLEAALTPDFMREYLMAYPQEIVSKQVFSEPIPLNVLGDVLQAQGAEFRFLGSLSSWVDALMQSAALEGLSVDDELPRGRWKEGFFPRRLNRPEAYLWAIERFDSDFWYHHIPDDLLQDEAILLAVLRQSGIFELKHFTPEFLRRHADVVAQRIFQAGPDGFSPSPMLHLHHMGESWINETLQKLVAEYPSYWVIDVYADDVADLLTDDTRAALNAWRAARPSYPHSFSWKDLEKLHEDTWTREMCEPFLKGYGFGYLSLPPRLRTLPLLLIALRTEPGLLKHLPVEEVTEAIALSAMVEAGILPGLVPRHIRDSPSFLEALGELPDCAYHPTAINKLIDQLFDPQNIQGPGITWLDELNRTWIEKLLQQDPRRALDFDEWDRLSWGVRAYREGGASLDDVKSRLLPALLPDFLAAVGPFAAGRVTPAGASGSSLATPPQPARAPE